MKYFVISDIHSFFSEMIWALKKAGYDKTNKDHMLIICGDVFDRGDESVQLYNYLKSIPKSRKILIKGNHESLLIDAINRGKFYQSDLSNGTVRTVLDFLNISFEYLVYNQQECCDEFKKLSVWKWLNSKEWKDYYELDNFIFVHSFIPLHNPSNTNIYGNFNYNDYLVYDKDWRLNMSENEWEEARWGCPWRQLNCGLFDEEIKNNKILVCGHWTVSDMHKEYNNEYGNYSIYCGNNLIGLDTCTALSRDVNVLIIDNNECFDKFGNKLK